MLHGRHSKVVFGCILLFLPLGHFAGGDGGHNPSHRFPRSPPKPPKDDGRGGPPPDGQGPPGVILGPEMLTMRDALEWCRNNNSHLLVLKEGRPASDLMSEVLRPYLNTLAENGIRQIWLGMELHDERSGSSESTEEPQCDFYTTNLRREAGSCFDKHYILCYKKYNDIDPGGNGGCGPGKGFKETNCTGFTDNWCVAVDTHTSATRNWFDAKEQCYKYNADLLPPNVPSERLRCIMEVSNPPGHIWIDESEVSWYWLLPGREGGRREGLVGRPATRKVKHFDWAPGAPSDIVKKCVKLVPEFDPSPSPTETPSGSLDSDASDDDSADDEAGWYDEDCNKQLHFVCLKRPRKPRRGASFHAYPRDIRDGSEERGQADQRDPRRPERPPPGTLLEENLRNPDEHPRPGPGGHDISTAPPRSREQRTRDKASSNIETILFVSIPIATSLVIMAIIGSVCYVQWSRKKEKKVFREKVANALTNPGYVNYDTVSESSLYQTLDESRINNLANTTPYTDLQDAQNQSQGQGQGHPQLDREDSDYYSEINHGSISREPSQRTISETSLDSDKFMSDNAEEQKEDKKPDDNLRDEQVENNEFYDSPKPMPEYLELVADESIHSNLKEMAAGSEIVNRQNSRSHVKDNEINHDLSKKRKSNNYHPS